MRQGKPSSMAVAIIACLLGTRLVAAQDGTITVTSPTSGDEIYSGVKFTVDFEVSEGVTEPYDVDLFEHNGEISVHSFCDWDNACDTDGGSVSVTIPEKVEIGVDYEIVVTERSSALFGTSDAFELLEAPEESGVVKFRHVGGGGGAVGDMNTAMIVMASVCGVILMGALCVASWFAARRRAAIADGKGMGSEHDIERSGMGGGYGDTSSRAKSNSSTPTYRRSMQSSTSLKNMHTPGSQHPYSSGSGMRGGDSVTEYSSSRTLARGDTQRARSNSHDSRNGSDDSRIHMYSNSSRRGGDGYDEGGPVMLATTPARSRTTGRSITPRLRSNSGSSRGRQMYNASNPPYEDGKDWGDPNRRRSSYSPRSRNRSSEEGRDFDWRSWGGGGSRSGHRSGSGGGGSERPPRFDDGPAEYFGDRASMDAEMPPRRFSRHHSPRGRQYRSRSQESSHGRSGGHGHSHGGSHRGHILAYRRSSSASRVSPTRSSSESTDWTSEGSRRRNDFRDDPRNDRRGDLGRSMPAEEMGRRRGRRSHSTSSRSRSRPDRLDVEDGGRYDHRRRDFECRTAPNEGEWRRRRNFESPPRHSPYRSGMAEPGVPPDVSWEELRSRYLRDKNHDQPRVTKSHSLPEYGDVIRESDSLSTEGSGNPLPSANHERVHSADDKPSAGGAGEQWHDSVNKDRSSQGSSGKPNLGAPAPALSPSTRADSARAAARDAQLSAERALAAAATASKAADLAARAAMEAEAEAEAERYSAGGPISMDNADEVTASTLTPNASVRARLAAFSPGSARMAGSADKNKEQQHKGNTPEEVAGAAPSRSRGRPDNSWVTARVRGPDTAGGSGGASGSGSVGGVGGQAGKTGVGGGGVDGSGRDSSVDSVGDIGGVHGRRRHHEGLSEDLAAKRRAFVRQYSGSTCDDSEISLFDNVATGIGGRKPYLSMNSEITSFDESEYSFGEGMQAMEAYARRTSGTASPRMRGGAAAEAATAAKDRVEIAVRKKNSPANGAPSSSPKATKEAAATAADKNISEVARSLEPGVAAT